MASLTEIAWAHLEIEIRRLQEIERRISASRPEDMDDSEIQHQGPARLIDALAKNVSSAIDGFDRDIIVMANRLKAEAEA